MLLILQPSLLILQPILVILQPVLLIVEPILIVLQPFLSFVSKNGSKILIYKKVGDPYPCKYQRDVFVHT